MYAFHFVKSGTGRRRKPDFLNVTACLPLYCLHFLLYEIASVLLGAQKCITFILSPWIVSFSTFKVLFCLFHACCSEFYLVRCYDAYFLFFRFCCAYPLFILNFLDNFVFNVSLVPRRKLGFVLWIIWKTLYQ